MAFIYKLENEDVGGCAVLELEPVGAVYRQAEGSTSQNLPETEV